MARCQTELQEAAHVPFKLEQVGQTERHKGRGKDLAQEDETEPELAAEEPAAAASHRSDLGQAMRLVRFDASARPTLDLRIGSVGPNAWPSASHSEHGHRPALAPRPPEVVEARGEFGATPRNGRPSLPTPALTSTTRSSSSQAFTTACKRSAAVMEIGTVSGSVNATSR